MNYNNLCYRCFCEKPIREKPCPKCGYKHTADCQPQNCLPAGTLLKNRYIVGVALGVGGFGITYKCFDTQIGGVCAVKEYFPASLAQRSRPAPTVYVAEQNLPRYNKIMERFVEEANLVRELHHRNVITIYDSFFANKTAYYAMEYCDGIDLRRYTDNFKRRLEYDEGMNILYQVMNGLEYIHSKGILHRDIAPDNIYITKSNCVKILDFGSARHEMDQMQRNLSVIIKAGYAPIEQYGSSDKQGPYTDIYALGATFYHLFTAKMPLESTQRIAGDTLIPFSQLRPDLPVNLKYCIEKSMVIRPFDRVANIAEMKRILGLTKVTGEPVPQSAPPTALPNSPRGAKAGIGARCAAYALDFVVWMALYWLVLCCLFDPESLSPLWGSLFVFILMLINIVSEMAFSATLGKALLGMRVRSKSGNKITSSQVLLRNIIKLLGIFLVMSIGNGELLEDRATNSEVVSKRKR